jgi:hypothetical protein
MRFRPAKEEIKCWDDETGARAIVFVPEFQTLPTGNYLLLVDELDEPGDYNFNYEGPYVIFNKYAPYYHSRNVIVEELELTEAPIFEGLKHE